MAPADFAGVDGSSAGLLLRILPPPTLSIPLLVFSQRQPGKRTRAEKGGEVKAGRGLREGADDGVHPQVQHFERVVTDAAQQVLSI